MLETALKTLFDYQRFERSAALQSVIDEVQERYARGGVFPLADDDLALAAGGVKEAEKTKRELP